ncbi:MAG: hypothetical protein MUF49_18185 [Oculatellaceae cyanobacterium Prado106]|nr:hypothetical protein [Oculatellaceae cyanobacterium Prado106]
MQFLGGSGVIKRCKPEAGIWTYVVEMEMGQAPETGRIGSETSILLTESDLLHR